MGQVHHGSATTTAAVGGAKESLHRSVPRAGGYGAPDLLIAPQKM